MEGDVIRNKIAHWPNPWALLSVERGLMNMHTAKRIHDMLIRKVTVAL